MVDVPSEFIAGDCVRLKDEAGRIMLVDNVLPLWNQYRVRCMWVDLADGIQFADFDAKELERIQPAHSS